jgi:hypothetical protein
LASGLAKAFRLLIEVNGLMKCINASPRKKRIFAPHPLTSPVSGL